jgi:hypothetical protein
MSGYVASARIARAAPRFVAPARLSIEPTFDPLPTAALATVVETDAATDATEGEHSADLAAAWAAFRERWAQLTFYLVDPDSWR